MISAFSCFELNESFQIDLNVLEIRYLKLQREEAADLAQINLAYEILRDDVQRAVHLLELNGVDLNTQPVSSQLLNSVLEGNETIEELSSRESLEGFIGQKTSQVDSIKARMQALNLPRQLMEFTAYAIELKYVSSLIKRAKEKHISLLKFT